MKDIDLATHGPMTMIPGEMLSLPEKGQPTSWNIRRGEFQVLVQREGAEVLLWVFGEGDRLDLGWLDRGEVAVVIRCVAEAQLVPLRESPQGDAKPGDSDYLSILRERVFADAAEGCRILTYETNETVFTEGEPGDAAYFILRGEAQAIRGDQVSLSRMIAGQCFGEIAVLDGSRRTATVTAASPLHVLRVEAATFSRWVLDDSGLRSLVDVQKQIYRGPDGATVTVIREGTYEGSHGLTSFVRYADGRRYSATKLTDSDTMIWRELSQPEEVAETLEYQDSDTHRIVHLSEDRRIQSLEAHGSLEGTSALCSQLISNRPLSRSLQARFRWSGTIDKPASGELLCACVGLTVEDAAKFDPETIRAITGAGQICGSCDHRIDKLQRLEASPEETRASDEVKRLDTSKMRYREFFQGVIEGQIKLPSTGSIVAEFEKESPESSTRSNRTTGLHTALMIVRLLATAGATAWATQGGHWFLMALCWVIQGFNYYSLSALIHEFAHNAGFTNRSWNRLFGSLLSLPLLSRFAAFQKSHLEHHRVSQSYEDPKVTVPAEKNWHPAIRRFSSWAWRHFEKARPLTQNTLIATLMLLFAAPVVLLSYAHFSIFRPMRTRDDVLESLGIVTLGLTVFLALGWQGGLSILLAPLFFGYAFISVVFMTHTHEYSVSAVKHHDDEAELMIFNIVNLTLGRFLDRAGFYFHRYHVEHHLIPTLPFYHLPKLSKFLDREYGNVILPKRRLGFDYFKRGYLDTIKHYTPMDIAGRRYYVGSMFDDVLMGDPYSASPKRSG